ncbi:MAG: PIN domain-containing protein [Nitrospirales bacterium]
MTTFSPSILVGGSLGLLVGMVAVSLGILAQQIDIQGPWSFVLWGLVPLILFPPYLGVSLGLHFSRIQGNGRTPSHTTHLPVPYPQGTMNAAPKLLDSSAIIDGRILHLCTTGFLEGPLFIPEFILREIHLIADSDNPSKRTRGKRGLEIVENLQQLSRPEIVIIDDHPSRDLTVDHQLIALAKIRKAHIVTNDWNLAKVANAQGVKALNVNELTYHLRPPVLPGDIIRVFVQKKGQGFGQGIAHLDDGTMVVIDHGGKVVGRTIDIEVTRYMQTNTGKMVFAFPKSFDHSLASNRSPLSQSFLSDMALGTVEGRSF